MKKGKKGVIEPAAAFLITMILIIAFFIMAYLFLFTSTGPKALDAFNYYVGSKVGIVVTPQTLEKLKGPTSLSAQIMAVPKSPVCASEPIYFSAYSSTLPEGVNFSDANCYWDFDTATEPCSGMIAPPEEIPCAPGSPYNNSNTKDDYQKAMCFAVWKEWLSTQDVQLIVVAGGKTDAKTLTVTSALSCACAVSSGANPSGCNEEVATQPWLSSPAIIENYGTLNVSFKDSWNLAAVHLIIVPNGQLSNLRVGSGPDNGFILKGNLTNPTIVSGSGRDSFLRFIEDKRGDCRLNGLDPCTIPLAFAFDGSGTITVKEIWIPLS